MAKKKKGAIDIDYHFGIPEVIPSTKEAFQGGRHDGGVRKEEGEKLVAFKKKVVDTLDEAAEDLLQFPTQGELFVFILQFFVSQREYRNRDVDNLSKTILDLLKGRFYEDDGQVTTLLASKRMDKKVDHNFAYIAIKELTEGREPFLKEAGLARAITFYYDTKKKNPLWQ
jgi:Holliday junction resolvase RusA-like endonuclease